MNTQTPNRRGLIVVDLHRPCTCGKTMACGQTIAMPTKREPTERAYAVRCATCQRREDLLVTVRAV